MYKNKWLFSMLLITALAACGATPALNYTSKSVEVAQDEEVLPVNPLDVPLEEDAFTISGVSETSFNKSTIDIHFLLKGTEFLVNRNEEVTLSVNDVKSVTSDLRVSAGKISAPLKLVDGKNLLSFKAYDVVGRPLYKNMTLWSGSNAVDVVLVDEKGAPFKKPVNIKLSLEEDKDIYSSGTTTTGSLVFSNIPSRSVSIEAHSSDNIIGLSTGLATNKKNIVTMIGFKPVSKIKNNDFSSGTSGWVGNIKLVPHVEEVIVTPMPTPSK